MKQHTIPVRVIADDSAMYQKIPLGSTGYDEHWLQRICYKHPSMLPLAEMEPTFSGMVPICTELSTKTGSADLIYINDSGQITIGECKLWRNPEARRKVVGQILDYAKDITGMDYEDFEKACLKARKDSAESLFELVSIQSPEMNETEFVDNVQRNLKLGRFLLAIIGDGIRENTEEITSYLQRGGGLNFTLGLVEMPVYRHPDRDELLITPRLLLKTREIERVIYTVTDKMPELESEPKQVSLSISEKVFYERLEANVGTQHKNDLESFVERLGKNHNIVPTLGRGKRLSYNLKSLNGDLNFASIQETGKVWFYGIVSKTEDLGDKTIGIDYLKNLAGLVSGYMDDNYTQWQWCVKRGGEFIDIADYLKHKDEWEKLIAEVLERVYQLEDS